MKRLREILCFVFISLPIACLEFYCECDLVGIAHAEEQDRDSTYIAPFVPTPQEVVDRMLELA